MIWFWPLIGFGAFAAFILFIFWVGPRMEIREQNDRHRSRDELLPFEICPYCGHAETVRVGLAVQCTECGEFLRPLEAA